MEPKWKYLIITLIFLILGGAIIITWIENNESKVIGRILNDIPTIDSISVKDGNTQEEVISFSNSDDFFSEMVDVYDLPFYNLKWSEKKLLRDDPFIQIEYLRGSNVQFTISVYKVSDDNMFLLPDGVSTEVRKYGYNYSPEDCNKKFIFVIKEINQLLGVNEGLKKLLNSVI